jgi:hypothetical protein
VDLKRRQDHEIPSREAGETEDVQPLAQRQLAVVLDLYRVIDQQANAWHRKMAFTS